MRRWFLVLCSLWVGCSATDPSGNVNLGDRLQRALHKSLDEQMTVGATMGVSLQGVGTWSGASGFADPLGHQILRPSDRFRVGSLTKTFTAVIVLQLVEEGTLSLDEPVDTWFPDVPNAGLITVRELLNHTSGLFNYTDDPEVLAALDTVWTPDELIAVAARHEPEFVPGEHWSYSNTNYIMLGEIIERVTGTPYGFQLRTRLIDPLGLNNTFLEGYEPIPGGFVIGTVRSGFAYLDDQHSLDPSVIWSAGAMVSNVDDLLLWSRALFSGDVLTGEALDEMLTPAELADGTRGIYGLGIVAVDTEWGPYYWHNGRVNGYTAFLGYFPDQGATVATLVNTTNSAAWQVAESAWGVLLEPADTPMIN